MKNNKNIKEFSRALSLSPLIIHINPIGLLRVAKTNDERFKKFEFFLKTVENLNGNIAIPSYSYSFTKDKIYNIKESPSVLDAISDYLRVNNYEKRSADPNFSYLLFGNSFSKSHLKISKYDSFGTDSLIEEVFLKDGYIGAIGGAVRYFTEVHFIEKMLNVEYRFDKTFNGLTVKNDKRIEQESIFYCRNLEYKYKSSFTTLAEDLKKDGYIEEWFIEGLNLKIELIKFKKLYSYIKLKLGENPFYLCKEV